jgi:Tol biopolymer transport system component
MRANYRITRFARWTRIAVAVSCGFTALQCAPQGGDGDTVFGLTPPGIEPVRFAPEILSAERHPHGSLTFSPNGREIYWSAFLEEGPEQTVFFSIFDGDSLSTPRIAPFAPEYAGGPSFSGDGQRIVFNSRIAQPDQEHALYGIWFADRFATGWTVPEQIRATFDGTRTSGQTTLARNGNLYFSARIWSEPLPRLYRSVFSNGTYAEPEQLQGPINDYGAVDPYVDPDERFLLFAGIDRADTGGHSDIHISRRQGDGSWGEPVNLGLAYDLESDYFDRFPSMSRDGKYLFFVRAIGDTFPTYDTHFYWVSAEVLVGL